MTLLANDWKNQARGLALLVLENVFEDGAYSNIALNQELSHTTLLPKDKSLVMKSLMEQLHEKLP